MPFESKRQSRYFFANPGKLGGLKKVKEFAENTDYRRLPESAASRDRHKLGPPERRKKRK